MAASHDLCSETATDVGSVVRWPLTWFRFGVSGVQSVEGLLHFADVISTALACDVVMMSYTTPVQQRSSGVITWWHPRLELCFCRRIQTSLQTNTAKGVIGRRTRLPNLSNVQCGPAVQQADWLIWHPVGTFFRIVLTQVILLHNKETEFFFKALYITVPSIYFLTFLQQQCAFAYLQPRDA